VGIIKELVEIWLNEVCDKEEIEEEKSGIREWTKKDDNEIGNLVDPYYEL